MQKAVTLRLDVEREDDLYVARCPELDISSYGDTVEDAVEHLKAAIMLYLDTIEQDGERERISTERGITIENRPEAAYRATLQPDVFATVGRFAVGAA